MESITSTIGIVTRSGRRLSIEKGDKDEEARSAASTPTKRRPNKRLSIKPDLEDVMESGDDAPAAQEANEDSKLLKIMEENPIPGSLPRDVSGAIDSPSRNLRKRNMSTSPDDLKSKSPSLENVNLRTPIKKSIMKRVENSLLQTTIDSPKPRKKRTSIGGSDGDTQEVTPLRRSRRLSTELNVVVEDPMQEAMLDHIQVPITRRGKRLSVIPLQPSVPEENEEVKENENVAKDDNTLDISPSKKFPKMLPLTPMPPKIGQGMNESLKSPGESFSKKSPQADNNASLTTERKSMSPQNTSLTVKSPQVDNNTSLTRRGKNLLLLNTSIKSPQKYNETSLYGREIKSPRNASPLKSPQKASPLKSPQKDSDTSLTKGGKNLSPFNMSSEKSLRVDHDTPLTKKGKNTSLTEKSPLIDKDTSLTSRGGKSSPLDTFLTIKSPQIDNDTSLTRREKKLALLNASPTLKSPQVDNYTPLTRKGRNSSPLSTSLTVKSPKVDKDTSLTRGGESLAVHNTPPRVDNNTFLTRRESKTFDTSPASKSADNMSKMMTRDKNRSLDNKPSPSICLAVKSPEVDKDFSLNSTRKISSTPTLNTIMSPQAVLNISLCKINRKSPNSSDKSASEKSSQEIESKFYHSERSKKIMSASKILLNTGVSPVHSKLENDDDNSDLSNTSNEHLKLIMSDNEDCGDDTETARRGSDRDDTKSESVKYSLPKRNSLSKPEIDFNPNSSKGLNCEINKCNTSTQDDTPKLDKLNESNISNNSYDTCSEDKEGMEMIVDSASDAGSNYQSGDSMDLSQRKEMEMNEIVEKGESLNSESSEDDSNDTYEKDSFVCSSEVHSEDEINSNDNLNMSFGDNLNLSKKSGLNANSNKSTNLTPIWKGEMDKSNGQPNLSGSTPSSATRRTVNVSGNTSLGVFVNSIEKSNTPLKSTGLTNSSLSKNTTLTNVSKKIDVYVNVKSPNSKEVDLKSPFTTPRLVLSKPDTETLNSNAVFCGDNKSFSKSDISAQRLSLENGTNVDEILSISRADLSADSVSTPIIKKISADGHHTTSTRKKRLSSIKSLDVPIEENAFPNSQSNLSGLSQLTQSPNKSKSKDSDTEILENVRKLTCSSANLSLQSNTKSNQKRNSLDSLNTSQNKSIQKLANINGVEKKSPGFSSTISPKLTKKIEDGADENYLSTGSKKDERNRSLDIRAEPMSELNSNEIITSSVMTINSTTSVSNFEIESMPIGGKRKLSEADVQWTSTAGEFQVVKKPKAKPTRPISASNSGSTSSFRIVPLKKSSKAFLLVDDKLDSKVTNFKQEMLYGNRCQRKDSSKLLKIQQKLKASKNKGSY